ncbi:MAG: hypothetical protein WCI49_10835 [Ferruginibacter sp.]
MIKYIVVALCFFVVAARAQNSTASNLIEGGKTLVELVRVFKTPKNNVTSTSIQNPGKIDSCAIKNISDCCFKNSTAKSVYISLYKRNGATYEAIPLTIKVLSKSQECWYELRAGIYKFKIEIDGEDDKKITFREGEMKLGACENAVKDIKSE